jgi:hypothetical protein
MVLYSWLYIMIISVRTCVERSIGNCASWMDLMICRVNARSACHLTIGLQLTMGAVAVM